MAILIGSGNREESAVALCKRILASVGNNLSELGKLSIKQLMTFKGIGEAKAIAVIAALELGRRRNQSVALKMQQITSSRDVANFLQPVMGDLSHEEFWVLHLHRHNKIINYERISQGGLTGTVIDVRVILKKALEKLATSIIIAHNHPSGNLQASDSDRKITRQLKAAASLMEIPLLDHLIITQTGYYSFADEGIL